MSITSGYLLPHHQLGTVLQCLRQMSGLDLFTPRQISNGARQFQGEMMRVFLTQTSIIDRFNAELCNSLTGRNDSQVIITQL